MEGKRAKRDARSQQGFSSRAARAQVADSSSSTQGGGLSDLLQPLEEPGGEEGVLLPPACCCLWEIWLAACSAAPLFAAPLSPMQHAPDVQGPAMLPLPL